MSAYDAYQKNQNTTQSPRDMEYRLIGQITAALIAAQEESMDVRPRVDALLWNRKLWAAFRADLVDERNALPMTVRLDLLKLAAWVERETIRAMSPGYDLTPLINNNKEIMEGLLPSRAREAAPLMPAPVTSGSVSIATSC